ncbi:unnamed protein product [Ilex paraguariensis]|uniref:Uncharacterized protein n=1 Tax=Ilex paraguariensis TaxID=185542 RepID=A0ABC8UWZ5_9AQUA
MAEASSHNCSVREGGHERKLLFNRLDKRLRILEEEIENMKQDILVTVEDRTKLITEIYDQFQAIHHFIHLRDQEEEKPCDEGLTIMPSKVGRTGAGLSQILSQESNSSLVIRDLRATTLVLQHQAQVVIK